MPHRLRRCATDFFVPNAVSARFQHPREVLQPHKTSLAIPTWLLTTPLPTRQSRCPQSGHRLNPHKRPLGPAVQLNQVYAR